MIFLPVKDLCFPSLNLLSSVSKERIPRQSQIAQRYVFQGNAFLCLPAFAQQTPTTVWSGNRKPAKEESGDVVVSMHRKNQRKGLCTWFCFQVHNLGQITEFQYSRVSVFGTSIQELILEDSEDERLAEATEVESMGKDSSMVDALSSPCLRRLLPGMIQRLQNECRQQLSLMSEAMAGLFSLLTQEYSKASWAFLQPRDYRFL